MEFEEDIKNLLKVSLFAMISLDYCYFMGKIIPKGLPRLFMILPVILYFLSIPMLFNSVHLIGAFSLCMSWLGNFKLILFAFETGPLSSPSIPLSRFIPFACLPIGKSTQGKNPTNRSPLNYAIKAILLAVFVKAYHDYGDQINPIIAWMFFSFSVYFILDLVLATSSRVMEFLLGVKLDPQFDEPYLSTSLQDFWGRRWNVMVNRILYPTIYSPVRTLSSRVIGRVWAPVPAIFATFAVSGLMHELIFFYFTRDWPTWDTMLFFCLHGVSLVMEIMIKKSVNAKWSLPRHITTPLIVAFVLTTSYWLFFPDLRRCRMIERAFEDYGAIAKIVKRVIRTVHYGRRNDISS